MKPLTSWENFLLELSQIDSEEELKAMLVVERPQSYQARVYSRYSMLRRSRELQELKRYTSKKR